MNARSVCKSTRWGGMVASNEACDVGVNDGANGDCNADCTLGPRCGDGVLQAVSGEACDDGINLISYSVSTTAAACAPGCKKPEFCGDGMVDSVFGEACDDTKKRRRLREVCTRMPFGRILRRWQSERRRAVRRRKSKCQRWLHRGVHQRSALNGTSRQVNAAAGHDPKRGSPSQSVG